MKKTFLLLLTLWSLVSCIKNEKDEYKPVNNHPKADSLQKILKKYTAQGVPGAVIAVKDANGFWAGAEGFANLEDGTKMKPDMLQYGFSITKMVTAIAVMQLKEKGLIQLDKPIKEYLPAQLQSLVSQPNVVTVRMLLNHSTGYNDYVRVDKFVELKLQEPLKVWKRADFYDFIKQYITIKFTPGTDYQYSNTNYYLLSLLIDNITGKPHGDWFQQNIFNKLSLKQTFYKNSSGYPFYNNLPQTYWPGIDGGQLENITPAQQAWLQSEEYGATGIIASPKDYIRLLEGLVNGELVSAASLAEMKQWIQGSTSTEPDYGLGLGYWGFKGKANFGHDGDGIGATIELLYFPDSKTYVLAAANASTEFGGDIALLLHGFRNEVGNYLASF